MTRWPVGPKWLLAAIVVIAALPAAALALSRGDARSAAARVAVRALDAQRHSGAEIVFGTPAPVPAGRVISEAGPRRPASSGRVTASRSRVITRLRAPAWLFYQDLAPYQQYEHAGRIVLVDARSNHVLRVARLAWPPAVNGRLPVFLASQTAYDSARYRVLDHPYTSRAKRAAAEAGAASRIPLAARSVNDAFDPAGSSAVARMLAAQRSCAVRVSDTVPGGYYTFAQIAQSRAALGYRFAQFSALQSGFRSVLVTSPAATPTATAVQRAAAQGCKDVLVYLAGAGYPGAAAANAGLGVVRSGLLQQDVLRDALTQTVRAHRNVHFEFILDAPQSAAFHALIGLPNVLLIATPVAPGGGSFTYLPGVELDGHPVTNIGNPRHLLQLTDRLAFGMSEVVDDPAETAWMQSQDAAGKLPSVLAFLVARSFARGGAVDFVAQTGVGSPPWVQIKGFSAAGPPQPQPQPRPGPQPQPQPQPANQAPVLSGIETSTLSYAAGTPAVHITSTLATSDSDDTKLAGATVRIASGFAAGEDELAFTSANGITGTYDAATGVLALTGAASLPDYQAALRSVTYRDPNGASPTTGRRTVAFQVDDGHASHSLSNVETRDIQVSPAPTPVANPDAATTDKATATDIHVLANDSDPSGLPLHVASVDTTGTQGAVHVNPDGTVHYDPNGQFSSLQQGQSATDTFSYKASDGFHDSSAATVTVTVTGVNDPPVLANIETTPVQYAAATAPVHVTSTLTVSTPPGVTTLAGATVAITNGRTPSEDVLGFSDQNGISGSYDPASGVLALTGTAPVADYQAALRSVTYSDTNGASPSTGPRTVAFEVDDGRTSHNLSNVVTRDVEVNPNPPPVASADSASTDKHSAVDISVLANDADPDGEALSVASVDTTGTKGSVSINPDGTIHYDPNGQFATLQQNQAATDTFTYKASDGFHDSNSATVTVTIHGSNDAPVLANIEGSAVSYRAQDPAVPITSSLTVSDADDATLASATASITSGFSTVSDTLGFTNQNGISGSYDAATGVLSLTGSAPLADYQAALRSVTFSTSDGSASPASRTVSFAVTDPGGATSNTVSRAIDVAAANQPPVAGTDAYDAVGNTPLGVGTSPSSPAVTTSGSVLANDSDPDSGSSLTVTSNTAPSHGSVTMNPDGTFTYIPDAGFTGSDGFQYTVTDSDDPANPKSASGTVMLTVSSIVWYVDDSKASAGDGRAMSPFNTLAAANSAAGANSIVFLYQGNATYTGGLTMHPGESLLGQPHGLMVNSNTIVEPGGSNPTLTNGSGNGIDLAEGADVEAVNVSSPSGNGVAASGVNSATVGGTSAVTVSGAGGDGVHITGGNGVLAFGQASVSGAAGHSVSIANRTGGMTAFAGPITDRGTGISLTNNAGSTTDFMGTLDVSTGAAQAFSASGGGTVEAGAAGNTLTTTTGTALSVANTTIGSPGLIFKSISAGTASAGPARGISLVNTGTSAGLTVTGTGTTAGSGGTIQHTTSTGTATPGSGDGGIYLNNTAGVSLANVNVASNHASGIYGSGVTNLTLTGDSVTGNGTSGANDDDGIRVDGLGGNATIASSTVSGSAESDARLLSSTTGSLSVSVSGSTFSSAAQGYGLLVNANGAAVSTTATGDTFAGNFSDGLAVLTTATGGGALTFVATGNTVTNNTGAGIDLGNVGATANPTGRFTIANNTLTGQQGTAVNVINGGSATWTGHVNNNTVGNPAVANSGSKAGWGIVVKQQGSGTMTAEATGNTIRQIENLNGIEGSADSGSGTLNLTLTNNNIDTSQPTAEDGIFVNAGVLSSDTSTVCLAASGNTSKSEGTSAPAPAGNGLFDASGLAVDNNNAGTAFKIAGYSGAPTDDTAVANYLASQNTLAGPGGPAFAQHNASGSGFAGAASCPSPPSGP